MVKSPKQIGQQSSAGGPSSSSLFSPFAPSPQSSTGLFNVSISKNDSVLASDTTSFLLPSILWFPFSPQEERLIRSLDELNWRGSGYTYTYIYKYCRFRVDPYYKYLSRFTAFKRQHGYLTRVWFQFLKYVPL